MLRSEGLDPEGLSFAFRPLWQLDAPGQAGVALAKAQASAVYAGLGLWPAATVARLVEAQVAADGVYPNAEAVFAAARAADAPVPGAAAPAPAPAPGAAPTRDFDPAQPRDPDGRWTAGGNEAGTMTGPSGMSLDPAQSRDPIGAFSPRGGVTFGHQARGEPADLTARDPVEQAMVRQATVALAPFILASWLRQRAGEAVGALARGLSNWFAAGLPPDPPPTVPGEARPSPQGFSLAPSSPGRPPFVASSPRGQTRPQGASASSIGQNGTTESPYSFNQQAEDPQEKAKQEEIRKDLERQFDNTKEHTTDNDLIAAWRESRGDTSLRKADGTLYNHVKEVKQTQKSLRDIIGNLKGLLGLPRLLPSEARPLEDLLGEASRSLDRTERFVPSDMSKVRDSDDETPLRRPDIIDTMPR